MNLMDKVDNLILGGGMTYTFKAALGGHVGSSICEADKLDLALDIMRIAKEKGVNLVLSDQAVIADGFSNDANTKLADPMNIPDGWEGLDIGRIQNDSLERSGRGIRNAQIRRRYQGYCRGYCESY